ncbi:hypothetical protein KKH39_02530 [Patescibacteria group bacterium]|nr:hypothetical protein [Patescibacteria group bacterium]
MRELIITNIYIFVLATVLAILEIQIEGPNGWAKNLPTWRPKGNNFFIRIYKKFMSDREVTGYHITMFSFVFLILHLPYVFGMAPSMFNWLRTISFFFIFVVLWDFLWFVLNPYHPLKTFSGDHIWWHKKWFAGLPRDYYLSILLSGLVLLPIVWHYHTVGIIYWWLINLALFIFQTIMLILFTLYIYYELTIG